MRSVRYRFSSVLLGLLRNDPAHSVRRILLIAHAEHKNNEAIAELCERAKLEGKAATTVHDWMGATALEMLTDLLLELKVLDGKIYA